MVLLKIGNLRLPVVNGSLKDGVQDIVPAIII